MISWTFLVRHRLRWPGIATHYYSSQILSFTCGLKAVISAQTVSEVVCGSNFTIAQVAAGVQCVKLPAPAKGRHPPAYSARTHARTMPASGRQILLTSTTMCEPVISFFSHVDSQDKRSLSYANCARLSCTYRCRHHALGRWKSVRRYRPSCQAKPGNCCRCGVTISLKLQSDRSGWIDGSPTIQGNE